MQTTKDTRELASAAASIQQDMEKAGVAASKTMLEKQLAEQRAAAATKVMSKKSGSTGKQMGIAKATRKKDTTVEIARRIARSLAKDGPITIDDITEELIKKGIEKANRGPKDSASMWKGGIFRGKEWVQIGTTPSRLDRSHVRPVGLWALKSWLDAHSVNGRDIRASRFDLDGLRRDFVRQNPDIPKSDCRWFIGTSKLADDVQSDIENADDSYDGVKVVFVPDAVGALITKYHTDETKTSK